MPLTKTQADVLRLLASHRDPESYVAGSTPLNRNAPRYSSDMDVFTIGKRGLRKRRNRAVPCLRNTAMRLSGSAVRLNDLRLNNLRLNNLRLNNLRLNNKGATLRQRPQRFKIWISASRRGV